MEPLYFRKFRLHIQRGQPFLEGQKFKGPKLLKGVLWWSGELRCCFALCSREIPAWIQNFFQFFEQLRSVDMVPCPDATHHVCVFSGVITWSHRLARNIDFFQYTVRFHPTISSTATSLPLSSSYCYPPRCLWHTEQSYLNIFSRQCVFNFFFS